MLNALARALKLNPSPRNREATPLYRSRFGGLWIDRADALEVLQRKLRDGEVHPDVAEALRYYIEHGYVIFEQAVSHQVIDEYLAFFERAWSDPPRGIYAHSGGQVHPLGKELYDKVAKVSDLHYYFPRAADLVFAPRIRSFLEAIYERPAVVFQTMSMRKGSEEPLHTDTGPLTLTEPMSLAASWIALEDVRPGAGALQFVPGSHALPEVLNNGVSKGHNGDYGAYHKVLQETLRMCEARGLPTRQFMARKGDVLIWAADLMHGGAPIDDPSLTRKSLVSHYMPLGVMATFYDFSTVSYVPYANGGWRLDRIDTGSS
ncbi:MAG TPA: phytanoyl-CoA dioxygenase family protein [Usitatibacter sp.]|nr:phytanoyl-CoA dioxygenase family protein [Usitatibacter sp.]